jgi:diaminopimelate decarboxylase
MREQNLNLPVSIEINAKGHMNIGGCDTVELAKQFGTPLYVMDEETLRENCRSYIHAAQKFYPNTEISYASKALSVLGVLKVIKEEGLGIDVVSGGELFLALKAGFDPQKIFFHGNNKTPQEISEALIAGVGTIVLDGLEEAELVNKLAGKANKLQKVLLRVTPGVEAHTHEFIKTGQLDSKFGVHVDKVPGALEEIKSKKHLDFWGLHVHIGSQILETIPFNHSLEIMMDLIAQIKKQNKLEVKILDVGGGLGISYLANDNPPLVEDFFQKMIETMQYKAKALKLNLPKLILEPGRSIVGRAGVTLYTIGVIKDIKGFRKYVCVDGGMADNPRPITYQARYDALIANKLEKKKSELVTVAGKFCESGDILIKDIQLQPMQAGDILAVPGTGAYNYSMASNYNQVLRPAMLMVNKGKAELIVRRETYDDLIRNHAG